MGNPLFDLTGRSALVTGAAGGIGSAVARAFAVAGADVLVTDLDEDAAAAVAQSITAAGGRAESAALDVADRGSADAAAAQAAAMTGGVLNIVVNNAGVTAPAMFADITEDNVNRLIDIHVMGAFRVTQAALPFLATDGTGRVINVTSAAGITGTLGQVNYSMAKAGIIGFTKSLARELGPQEHPRQRVGSAGSHADDRDHSHQREVLRQHDATNPFAALGGSRRDRRRLRLPGVQRRLLRHGPGPARRRRNGDVTGPLAGITIVAMEQAVAAPICTRVLADFGARVIKVENPRGGDFARDYDDVVNGPGGLGAHFVWCNRGKESVTLNLKSPAAIDVLHRLLDGADAFVSNLAPGATARLGLGRADLGRAPSERHPGGDRRVRAGRPHLAQAGL